VAENKIRFDDGAAYERMMGVWSRLAGEVFLDWLAPPSGLRWIDIGCGNGAFTELLVERCAPVEVQGIDPSEAQLAFARSRPAARVAEFRNGSAMELPFADGSFDAAVFPLEPVRLEMQAMGVEIAQPPSPGASRMEALRELWRTAGLEGIETREITVRRSFEGFEDFWTTSRLSSSMGPAIAAMAPTDVEQLKARVQARLPAEAAGRLTCSARANAVKGRMPK